VFRSKRARPQKSAQFLLQLHPPEVQCIARSVLFKSAPDQFSPNIDGYFLSSDPRQVYYAGQQSHVPLLAGWNADEAK
jgi:para-nitrobenzyl esterase